MVSLSILLSTCCFAHDEEFEYPSSSKEFTQAYDKQNIYEKIWICIDGGHFHTAKKLIDAIDCVEKEEFIHCSLIRLYISIKEGRRHAEMRAMDDLEEQIYMGYVSRD
jgi:hypothetical protein